MIRLEVERQKMLGEAAQNTRALKIQEIKALELAENAEEQRTVNNLQIQKIKPKIDSVIADIYALVSKVYPKNNMPMGLTYFPNTIRMTGTINTSVSSHPISLDFGPIDYQTQDPGLIKKSLL